VVRAHPTVPQAKTFCGFSNILVALMFARDREPSQVAGTRGSSSIANRRRADGG
jgi:hypothetical protein